MAEKKQVTAGRLFDNKNFVLLISIIAAVIFWMIISVTESPESENTIGNLSVTIPTENSVVSELGLDVIDDVANFKATVTVKGPKYVVGTLGQEDLSVTASIAQVTGAGTYELELRAIKQGGVESEYEIASISPSKIRVTFDFIDTKQFSVVAKAIGASAIEGLVAENPVVSDSNNATLTFKGSRTNMEKISYVEAVAEVNSVLSETKTFPSVLKIYDDNGKELPKENYTITSADGVSAPDIQISVPVSKMKTVSLKAQFINVPKAYQSNDISHLLKVTHIDIIGPAETVDNVKFISLSEIDFDNISENNQKFTTSLILPDGVKCADNIDSVDVVVTGLKNHTVKTYTVSSIEVKSNTNYTVTLSRSIKNVKVCGPSSVLKKLSSSQLYAQVDVEGKQKGEHTVSARIMCKTSDAVWQVGTYTATVVIK